MPGKTISTQFNPGLERVWKGSIIIQKIGDKHEVQYQFEEGTAATSKLVHEHLDKLIDGLNKGHG